MTGGTVSERPHHIIPRPFGSVLTVPFGLLSRRSFIPSGRKHNRGNEVMRETKSRENDGWARAPVPVTHILTLSGRSLQSQPFHRESFYVTGTLLAPESRSTFGSAHLASLGVNGMREGAT